MATELAPARGPDREKANRIVEAMRASVAERGIAGSTFDQVAKAAGVSRGLLHYYFGTKEQLLVEAVRRECDLRDELAERAIAGAENAEQVLDAMGRSFENFLGDGPANPVHWPLPAKLAGALVALVVLALVVAQLVLPSIAEQQLRDRLSRSGTVESVQISAFPAIELLWDDADHVAVRMRNYHSGTRHLGSLLNQAGGVDRVDASAGVLTAGLLTVRDAVLRKRGDELFASAHVTEADLRAALPVLQSVVPV